MTTKGQGPILGVGDLKKLAVNSQTPLIATFSGEIINNVFGLLAGAASVGGKLTNVSLSVGNRGRDTTDALALSADVRIGATSILTTPPAITMNSGEYATDLTTAVIDADNNQISRGQLVYVDLNLTRTTPDTEMADVIVVVDLEPNI